jgi:hypothetical protein
VFSEVSGNEIPLIDVTANPKLFDTVYDKWFVQFRETVDEVPGLRIYWGFWAQADWNKKGANVNALGQRMPFGPVQKREPNPFYSGSLYAP